MAGDFGNGYDKVLPLVDKPREECGVFGIYGPGLDVARLTYYGLYALQHRGQESAGIAVGNGSKIRLVKGMGLVSDVFSDEKLGSFQGHLAIGHVRYSTTGSNNPANAQPLVFNYSRGMIGLSHNGNISNITELRRQLSSTGSVFQSTTDSEVIVNLIARYSQNSLVEAIVKSMIDLKGAYSLLVLTENKLIGIRDPFGFRPLCLGRKGNAHILASESCALDTIGAEFVRDLEPGEIVVIDEDGLQSLQSLQAPRRKAHCIFEYIYFARPDSRIDGFNVNRVRYEMGRQLAREYPVEADLVIPVPDSGTIAARGFAWESGIPFEEGLMKNRYVGRTFIQPTQDIRELGVRLKLNPVRHILQGKRVVLIDDSIVRGTTSSKIVSMVRECGAREIHFCLSSPPTRHPCYYGIDTSLKELIAAHKTVEEIKDYISADGLHYLSQEGLLEIFDEARDNFCTACFSGDYPTYVPDPGLQGKLVFEEDHGCS